MGYADVGTDVGALQKEFFYQGMRLFVHEKYDGKLPFFEGETDHKLPTCDAVLLRSGVFKTIGMFMVHVAIHSGLAFVGLSRAIVEYLTTEVTDGDTPLTIGVDDLPSVEERAAVQNLDKLLKQEPITSDERTSLQGVAESCGFNGNIDITNCSFVRDQILYHTVIEKRQSHLEAMKLAFRQTPLLQFLKGRQYILNGLFPSNQDILNQPDLVTRKIECEGDSSVLDVVKSFITSECTDSHKLQALISAWTGWAILPDDPLRLKVVENGNFCFHSCFQELEIPSSFSAEKIVTHLRRVLYYGSSGFGTM